VILACIHEIETQDGPQQYVSTCCDNQAALKALQAVKQRLHWCNSARRLWWYLCLAQCGAVLGPWSCWMRGNKSPTNLQETFLFIALLDLSLSWGSLCRT